VITAHKWQFLFLALTTPGRAPYPPPPAAKILATPMFETDTEREI